MASSKGIVKIRGKVGGVTFSERDGKNFVKESTSLGKSRIMQDPAFKRTRENMAEFGGSAIIGKALRAGLAAVIRSFGDRFVTARLTALMLEVIKRGPGLRGQRSFEVVANGDVIDGFDFDRAATLGSVFNAPYTLTVNGGRNEVTLDVPDFGTDSYVRAPEGATHFRFVNVITALSDYSWDTTQKEYLPTDPAENSENALSYSGYIPLGGMVGGVTTLVSSLPGAPVLPATVGLVACIGIEFYQEVNGTYYLFATDNAMKIIKVF